MAFKPMIPADLSMFEKASALLFEDGMGIGLLNIVVVGL